MGKLFASFATFCFWFRRVSYDEGNLSQEEAKITKGVWANPSLPSVLVPAEIRFGFFPSRGIERKSLSAIPLAPSRGLLRATAPEYETAKARQSYEPLEERIFARRRGKAAAAVARRNKQKGLTHENRDQTNFRSHRRFLPRIGGLGAR
jgi:hypothetical protein